jgi:hypothetical protein
MVSQKTVSDYKINSERCRFCVKVGSNRCYGFPVVDNNEFKTLRATLTSYIESAVDDGFRRLDDISRKAKIEFDSTQFNASSNKLHIDYDPPSTRERTNYTKALNEDIKLCLPEDENKTRLKKLLAKSLEKKRDALQEFYNAEEAISLTRFAVDWHTASKQMATALAVERLVPCILHMKMRVIEKTMHSLVNLALERHGDGRVDALKKKQLVSDLEEVMQSKVFGNIDKEICSQWKFKWQKPGNTSMEKPNYTGPMADKVMKSFANIATVVYSPDLDQEENTAR